MRICNIFKTCGGGNSSFRCSNANVKNGVWLEVKIVWKSIVLRLWEQIPHFHLEEHSASCLGKNWADLPLSLLPSHISLLLFTSRHFFNSSLFIFNFQNFLKDLILLRILLSLSPLFLSKGLHRTSVQILNPPHFRMPSWLYPISQQQS